MAPGEARKVVAVHLRSFPGFFLTQLGPRFLVCLYEEILRDPTGIALVYKEQGLVRGFVAGTSEPKGFYRRLLARRWYRFALASVVPVLKRPAIVPRLLRAFGRASEESGGRWSGLLMSIAVDPKAQAAGIGTSLVHAFLAECRARGLESVHLTTDRSGNDCVNRFYLRLGFTIARVITTPQGRVMNEYRIELSPRLVAATASLT